MFLFRKPNNSYIRLFLTQQAEQPFSYDMIGMTRGAPPHGYIEDHNRIQLGASEETWAHAVAAVRRWEMFNLGWVHLCWPDAPITVGTTVGILVRFPGCWSLNACRITYLVDEHGPVRRYGFGYGTLPEHAERGEERFTVEWHRDNDAVWYDIRAFSQPQQMLAKIGYPFARLFQKRFARDSKQAMLQAIMSNREAHEGREDKIEM